MLKIHLCKINIFVIRLKNLLMYLCTAIKGTITYFLKHTNDI